MKSLILNSMEISEFQNLIRKTYFEKDFKRGINKTFLWFVEEVGELSEEIRKQQNNSKNENLNEEFADVFAWLCSLANLYNLNLEESVIKKYGSGCPRCKKIPCVCKE